MSGADPGLQPERTELAWRRTSLALAIGSLVSLRLLPEALGNVVWAIPGILGLIAAGGLWAASTRRYRQTEKALREPPYPMPDGTTLFALAAVVFAASLIGLVAVLVSAVGATR